MRRFWHWLRHCVVGHSGHVEHICDTGGVCFIGLRCHYCSRLVDLQESQIQQDGEP